MNQNYTAAKTMMDANTPYALAANEFIVALGTLRKEAGV
jgi:hypothetical protein